MSYAAGAVRQFGEGPLSRAVAWVYTLLIVEVLFVLTTVPALIALMLLDRDASNVPLIAACALPCGPALSAAAYAVARRRLDLTDLKPAAAFWRGYRLNVGGVLRVWLPFLLMVTLLGVNLSHLDIAGVSTVWVGLLLLIAAVVMLWVVNALLITSLFTFRAVDVARLAAYFLLHKARVTVAQASLLIVAAGVTVVTSEAVLMLLASVFVAVLVSTSRPMTTEVEERFTA